MTDERWPIVKALFQAAVDRPAGERDAFLASAAEGDDALRREVESLLAWDRADDPPAPAALTAGQRIGVYEVVAPIGAGAMGEVYRARDTTLNRDVALKVLPGVFALDPERLARFTREARFLATLNHPNIAGIYGLEESHGAQALVLEFVDGLTLADRVALGPMSLDQALPLARQMAEALEAAHEKGIVHRDLKPANIKIREDGTVKLLDFGLAKALAPPGGTGVDAVSPAVPAPLATHAHVILGTAAYMSPEQARSRPVDTRTDIWAFGVIVFEILAGQRAFGGDTVSDTLASVLMTEPDWQALPAAVPPELRRLIRQCLDKDPKHRLQAIGDARIQIEDLLGAVPDERIARQPALPRRWSATILTVVAAAVVAAVSTWALTRPQPAKSQPVRFTIVPPAAHPFTPSTFVRDVAVSPDGTRLVYASDPAGGGPLMLHAIDQVDSVALGGITGASAPFFSPDGRWIGFFSGAVGGELKKVAITGGAPVLLCRTYGNSGGASWGADGTIVFATQPSLPGAGLLRVPDGGGEPTVLTNPNAARGENHLFPATLPGGRAILFTITSEGSNQNAEVAVLDLTTGQRKTLIRGGSQAEYVEPGYLVYASGGRIHSVRFDPVKLDVLSDPVPVVESVVTLVNGAAQYSVSPQGTLVYVRGAAAESARSLAWVDRQGHEEPIAAPTRPYEMVRLSPDGTRAAVYINDQDLDLWLWDFARRTLRRLTDWPGREWHPVWTPDGRRIVFSSAHDRQDGNNNLFWLAADNTGTPARLTNAPNRQGPTSISPDGTRLIVQQNMPQTGWDVRTLRIDDPSGETESLLQTKAAELDGQLSADGHWLAYQSDESGQNQIWVRPFPNVDAGHWQISTGGGITPVWARNGKELFYMDGTNAVTSVPIQTAPTFSAGTPTKLFDGRYAASPFWRTYDVSPDGDRFLMIKESGAGTRATAPARIVVVVNWSEELKRVVPAR